MFTWEKLKLHPTHVARLKPKLPTPNRRIIIFPFLAKKLWLVAKFDALVVVGSVELYDVYARRYACRCQVEAKGVATLWHVLAAL